MVMIRSDRAFATALALFALATGTAVLFALLPPAPPVARADPHHHGGRRD
jgi:hypothetical protein